MELAEVLETIKSTGNDRLMVGFNRRFAPMLVEMRSRFGGAAGGGVARYAVNAGQLGARSWYNDTKLEGSRFEGEGGHFIDTLSWWFDALPTEVFAIGAKDPHDMQVCLRFDDESLAVVSYVTNGNPRYPKEIFEVSAAGRDGATRQLPASHGLDRQKKSASHVSSEPWTRAKPLKSLRSWKPCEPEGPCPSRSSRSRPPPGRRWPWLQARRAGVRSSFGLAAP